MPKYISFYTNVGKTQITETDSHFIISGIPITVDNAVMNGLLYTSEENAKGMGSMVDRPLTIGHPDGDAYEAISLQNAYTGGYVTKTNNVDGVWFADASIKKSMLNAQSPEMYERLTNRNDIGVSTGLYTSVVDVTGNQNGTEYNGIATEQDYNHLAMLNMNEPPAGGEATFMRFNNENKEQIVINLDHVISNKTTECIDEESLINRIFNAVKSKFATLDNEQYNKSQKDNLNQKKVISMAHNQAIAKALNMSLEAVEALSDAELEAKITASQAQNKQEDNAVLAALNSMTEKLNSFEAKINESTDIKVNSLVADLAAKNVGLTENALKSLPVNELEAMHTLHCGVSNQLGGAHRQDNSKLLDSTLPE